MNIYTYIYIYIYIHIYTYIYITFIYIYIYSILYIYVYIIYLLLPFNPQAEENCTPPLLTPPKRSKKNHIVEADEADEVYYLLSDLFTYTRTLIYL